MVMSLLLAAARKRLASTIEQCSNIVVLRPGGRLAKPGANSGSILSLAKSPSSNATALITMFSTLGSEEARKVPSRWPPSAAQTARTVFPYAAFAKIHNV